MVMSLAVILSYLAWNMTPLSYLHTNSNGQFWLEIDALLRIMLDNDLDHLLSDHLQLPDALHLQS